MKLQILVPHWKELSEEMTPLLDSLKLQQGVDFSDFGVIIVYDGREATWLPEEMWRRSYPFDIWFVHADHGGVSHARNVALSKATADYVMFCDSDDMFCHMCGLSIIFREMASGFDTMSSEFVEEVVRPDTGETVFVQHKQDHTFVHGKVHRRQYLLDNGIKFNESLTVHEDSYFNVLVQDLAPDKEKVKYCPVDFYLWKWREGSICRHDDDYLLKTFPDMLKSNAALVEEFERRGHHESAQFYAVFLIIDSYYMMQTDKWTDPANQKYVDIAYARLHDHLEKHWDYWNEMDPAKRNQIAAGIRMRYFGQGMPMETMTLGQWLDKVWLTTF